MPQAVFYGKVVDDQGDPLMGVEVGVLAAHVVDGKFAYQRSGGGMTNDLGEYRVAGLTHGKYILCPTPVNGAVPGEGLTVMLTGTCYPGPVEGGSANAMELEAGRETKVDFTLTEAPVAHVRGTISGIPDGRGVGINLVPRTVIGGAGGVVGTPVREGRFDFRAGPGAYMLTADYFEAGKHLYARVPVDVGSSDVENVAVSMESGFALAGTARIDSQSQQSANKPNFGINLRPSDPHNPAGQARWETDRTSFVFADMLPGSYRLDATPPPPYYLKSATLAGQDILNGEFTLAPGAGPIEMVLADDGGSIEGDVVDGDGQPTSGGVMAVRSGKAAIVMASVNGHFKLQNLAPGEYKVYAWDDTSQVPYAEDDWMKRYAGSGADVTISSGQSSQIKLTLQTVPR